VTVTKVSAGLMMMTGAAVGNIAAAWASVLEELGADSLAYGIIFATTIGASGWLLQRRQNNRMYKLRREEVDELKRHNEAMEPKIKNNT